MRRTLILAAGVALLACSRAQAQTAPLFQPIRSDETYGYLKDPARRVADLDVIRFIPLDASDSVYLSLGGETRLGLVRFHSSRFGIGSERDTFGLWRTLLHADLHLGDRVRVYGELGNHEILGKRPPYLPSDRDRLDLQNLFVDVILDNDASLRLRGGRQELMFNPTQRFVSVREGPNIRQSFDGVRLTWKPSNWRIDAFAVHPVIYKPGAFDDDADDGQTFSGLYVSRPFKRGASALTVEGYLFDLDKRVAKYGAVTGKESRTSLGLRLAGNRGPWDFDWEGMAQTGTFAGQDIRAWGYGLDTGYTISAPWSPRLGLRLDEGSGDHDPADQRLSTFNPMFPRGGYFNESNLDSYINRRSVRAGVRVKPRSDLVVEVSTSSRWRETTADAVYLQPLTALAGTAGRGGRWVGQAYAIDAAWKPTRNLNFVGEVVHETAGDVIHQAGGHKADFLMLAAQFRF